MVVVSFCKNRASRRRLVTEATSLVVSKSVAILALVDKIIRRRESARTGFAPFPARAPVRDSRCSIGSRERVLQPKQSMGDPYEQLILEFVAEWQRQGRVPKSYDPQTRIFVFGHGADGDVKVQLDNLFRAWLALDQGGRSAVISRFVTGLRGIGQHSALVPEDSPISSCRVFVLASKSPMRCYRSGSRGSARCHPRDGLAAFRRRPCGLRHSGHARHHVANGARQSNICRSVD